MLCIINCETNNNTAAVNYNTNGTWDTGLCQINDVNWQGNGVCSSFISSQSELCDAQANVDCAFAIYQQSGFQPWSADARCGYDHSVIIIEIVLEIQLMLQYQRKPAGFL